MIALLQRCRVGGRYWGEQPGLPERYTLLRVRTGDAEHIGVQQVQDPVVLWSDERKRSADRARRLVITGESDPWHMVARATEVVVDADDEVALIAALSGVPVRSIGQGRFANLGEGGGTVALRIAVEQTLLRYDFQSPFDGGSITAEEAIALCGFWRQLIDGNRPIHAAYGCASWKRPTVAPLLWSGSGGLRFASSASDLGVQSEVAVWRSRTAPRVLREIEQSGARPLEIEDGFIRSSGLGADCIPPLSIVLDRKGIYFDPGQPSDLEDILQNGTFDPDTITRARKLREIIVARGITKYSSSDAQLARRPGSHPQILVTGQVEDDRAVLSGLGPPTNLDLLQRVRADAPGAYIIYKPHPDVEAGHRVGKIDDGTCLKFADEIIRDVPVSAVISIVDEVHVNTSLAGFEALLRAKRVVTYGAPFYAGWGLTIDKGPVPDRRSAERSLDELVAAALLVYPRYLDPLTGLPCPPEVLISRLSQTAPESPGLLVRLRRLQGALRRRLPVRRP